MSEALTTEPQQALAFSFGDPEPVLSNSLVDYLGVFLDYGKEYYEPPFSFSGLAKLLNANAHHGTIPYFRRNMITKYFEPSPVLSLETLKKIAFDHDVLGNLFLQRIENRFGNVLRFEHLPGINMRRMKGKDQYGILEKDNATGATKLKPFRPGEVIHLKEYDPIQSVYGKPQYLGGIHSVLLNESATLFRRKYYDNGAHMGYIFYTADGRFTDAEEKSLKEAIKKSKGAGNFRSMFLNIPHGKPDSVKIIPIGDIATKDEFERVKNISRNDILSMWRINPALAGVMPENMTGFGDIEKISRVYYKNEIKPAQQVFLQLNEYLPRRQHIRFSEPTFNSGQ